MSNDQGNSSDSKNNGSLYGAIKSYKDIKRFISSFPYGGMTVFVVSFLIGFAVFSMSGEDPSSYKIAGPWGVTAIAITVAGPVLWALFRSK